MQYYIIAYFVHFFGSVAATDIVVTKLGQHIYLLGLWIERSLAIPGHSLFALHQVLETCSVRFTLLVVPITEFIIFIHLPYF